MLDNLAILQTDMQLLLQILKQAKNWKNVIVDAGTGDVL